MRHTALRLYSLDEANPKTGYPRAWDEGDLAIKHQVRADAGDRCVRCHHPYRKGDGEWSACDERCTHYGQFGVRYYHDGPIWATEDAHRIAAARMVGPSYPALFAQWRILTVHHLDSNKLNCRWFNLVALCQRCHLEIQGKVKMERRWLHEHTDWFQPYVAGYYAWTRLGQDLSRPEVEARLEELLALEDRQLELGASA